MDGAAAGVELRDKEYQQLMVLAGSRNDARIVRRAQAMLWLSEEEDVEEVAERLGVSRQTIYNWAGRFAMREGLGLMERLADAPREGRPRIALGVIDPLIDQMLEVYPYEIGYSQSVWTAGLLTQHLRKSHGIEVSCSSVRGSIKRLRVSWKRPRHTLAQQSPTWRQAKGGSNEGCLTNPAPSR